MRTLILGGSTFLGPHLADALLSRKHSVTLFNRGIAISHAPPNVELIHGDRNDAAAFGRLAARRWDAVIDTCGFVPRIVRLSAEALATRAGHYTFISSINVYADPLAGNRDETEPLSSIADPATEDITNEAYGPLKSLCEREVRASFERRSLIVRPGLLAGPLDPTDRFTYWPHRFASGGDVLLPDKPSRPISVIDVRDLAIWIVRSIEQRLTGTFNAAGDPTLTTMGGLVEACLTATNSGARPVWASEEFLLDNGVEPWSEMPLFLPVGQDSLLYARSDKASAAGLTRRMLADTVVATLEWTRSQGLGRPLRAGLARDREAELLSRIASRTRKSP